MLAVFTPKRVTDLPDPPTVAEAGYKHFEADQRHGVVAPAGTPPDSMANLNSKIDQSLVLPELKTRLNNEGPIAAPNTPASFGKLILSEIARWKLVIQSGRVKAA